MRVSIPWCRERFTQENVDDFLSAIRSELSKYDRTHWITVHSVYAGNLCEPILFELDCLDIGMDDDYNLTISYNYDGIWIFTWTIPNIQNFVQLPNEKSYGFESKGAYAMYLQMDFLSMEEARKLFEEYMERKRLLERRIAQMENDFATYDEHLNG